MARKRGCTAGWNGVGRLGLQPRQFNLYALSKILSILTQIRLGGCLRETIDSTTWRRVQMGLGFPWPFISDLCSSALHYFHIGEG